MSLKFNSPFLQGLKGLPPCLKPHNCSLSFQPSLVFHNTRPKIYSSLSMAAGNPGDSSKNNLSHMLDKARKLWDTSPEPVKSFPWNRALDNFIQLILDLILAVVKYMCVPLLAVSSLSEMSYCAHERKLKLVFVPLLVGFAVAGILTEAALELSPFLKDADVPWHLIVIGTFSVLLKLPGPYYPYWGRILIPHFANGALLRVLWFAFLWYRRPKMISESIPRQSSEDNLAKSE